MFLSTYARLAAFFLGSTILASQSEAAAPPSALLDASSFYLRLGGAGIVNGTYNRGAHDTRDGCPVGWVECSFTTCYPLDGSECCSNGNFCLSGYYCDRGGCCRDGKICTGDAPPVSTVHGTVPPPPKTTTHTSTAIVTATFTGTTTTVSVGFTVPDQTTEFGTVTIPTVINPTVTVLPTTTPTTTPTGLATNIPSAPNPSAPNPSAPNPSTPNPSTPNPSTPNPSTNGAFALSVGDLRVGMWVAAAVALTMCMA